MRTRLNVWITIAPLKRMIDAIFTAKIYLWHTQYEFMYV